MKISMQLERIFRLNLRIILAIILIFHGLSYAEENVQDDISEYGSSQINKTEGHKKFWADIFHKDKKAFSQSSQDIYAANVDINDDNAVEIIPVEQKSRNKKLTLNIKLPKFSKEVEEKPLDISDNNSVWSSWNSTPTATTKNIKSKTLKKIEKKVLKDSVQYNETVNDVYLNKYTKEDIVSVEEFYKNEDIIETNKNNIKLDLDSGGKYIDTLIEQIENANPSDTFTPSVQISLKDCIGISIAKNPQILSSRITTDIYKDQVTAAWASYFPTFSLSSTYNHSGTKYKDYGFTSRSNSITYPSFSAGLLLFDFGKTKTGVDIAKSNYDASRYDLQDSINQLIYNVKSAYYNLLFAEKQIDVYKNTIEEFDLQLHSAKKFFEIGKKPQIDVVIAEYNAGNARLNAVKAQNTLETAKVTLSNVLGLPEFANFVLSDELTKEDYNITLDSLLKAAFEIRPDLISAEKALQSALLEVRLAKRAYTPDITADGNASAADADSVKTSSYGIGINMSYGSLNFLQLKKNLDVAQKSYRKALADYEMRKQSVYAEVKQAYISYETSIESIKQADLNVKQAYAQNYHASGRYRAGYGDAIELKDSENTYMNAQLSYYEALLEYNLSIAELERVVGKPIEKLSIAIAPTDTQDDVQSTETNQENESSKGESTL